MSGRCARYADTYDQYKHKNVPEIFKRVLGSIAKVDLAGGFLECWYSSIRSDGTIDNKLEKNGRRAMMDAKRYAALMKENEGRVFDLQLNAWEVGLLHGAIRLTLMQPEVAAEYCDAFKKAAGRLRGICLGCFVEMGFTPEEIKFLDSEEV